MVFLFVPIKYFVNELFLKKELSRISCLSKYKFPDYFAFGAGTSAYQVEGAWNEDGKGPSLWDHITQTFPSVILDKKNGNFACDSYHKLQEDLDLVSSMGLDFYRFSISWSRLLPNGMFSSFK